MNVQFQTGAEPTRGQFLAIPFALSLGLLLLASTLLVGAALVTADQRAALSPAPPQKPAAVRHACPTAAPGRDTTPNKAGRGLSPVSSEVALTGNRIAGNQALGSLGGGFYVNRSAIVLTAFTVATSIATKHGGGSCSWDSQATLVDNVLSGKIAGWFGGWLYVDCCNPSVCPLMLRGNTVTDNQAQTDGGVYVLGNAATIGDNLISGNWVSQFAGVVYLSTDVTVFARSPVSVNHAEMDSGGAQRAGASAHGGQSAAAGRTGRRDCSAKGARPVAQYGI